MENPAIESSSWNKIYSEGGFDALKERISLYITDLVHESANISRRYQSDIISAVHVRKAAEHLSTGSSTRVFKHFGTIGGILFGAGLSTVLSMVASNAISSIGVFTSGGLAIVGAFLVAFHIAKD